MYQDGQTAFQALSKYVYGTHLYSGLVSIQFLFTMGIFIVVFKNWVEIWRFILSAKKIFLRHHNVDECRKETN